VNSTKVFRLKPQEKTLIKTGHHPADAFNCSRSPISKYHSLVKALQQKQNSKTAKANLKTKG
jgi:hypothetical protein